jgi:hypothetical protein
MSRLATSLPPDPLVPATGDHREARDPAMEDRPAPPLVHVGRRRNLADAARASPSRALWRQRGKGGEEEGWCGGARVSPMALAGASSPNRFFLPVLCTLS